MAASALQLADLARFTATGAEEGRPDALVHLTVVASRIAHELGELAGLAESLQGLLPTAGAAACEGDQLIATGQNFDFLIQRLYGVRQFLTDLSDLLPPEMRVDAVAAARSVTLSRLQDYLSGRGDSSGQDSELELF